MYTQIWQIWIKFLPELDLAGCGIMARCQIYWSINPIHAYHILVVVNHLHVFITELKSVCHFDVRYTDVISVFTCGRTTARYVHKIASRIELTGFDLCLILMLIASLCYLLWLFLAALHS